MRIFNTNPRFCFSGTKSSAQLSEVTGAAQLVVAHLLLTARGPLVPLTPSRCVQFLNLFLIHDMLSPRHQKNSDGRPPVWSGDRLP